MTEKDKEFAGHLVRNLEGANQAVPQALMDLAMQVIMFHFIINDDIASKYNALLYLDYFF